MSKGKQNCCAFGKTLCKQQFNLNIHPVCAQGQATDIAIQAEEIMKLKRQINNIYAKHTGQPLETIGELY